MLHFGELLSLMMRFKLSRGLVLTAKVCFPSSYACDDYVINETQSKRILRALEQFQNNQASKATKRKDALDESGLSPVSRLDFNI